GQRGAIDENQGAVATTEVPPAPILMEVRDVSGTAKRASPHDSKRLRTNPVDRNGADGLRRNAASNSGVRVEQPHLDAGFRRFRRLVASLDAHIPRVARAHGRLLTRRLTRNSGVGERHALRLE